MIEYWRVLDDQMKNIEYLGINVPLEKMCSRLDLNNKSPGSAYITQQENELTVVRTRQKHIGWILDWAEEMLKNARRNVGIVVILSYHVWHNPTHPTAKCLVNRI